MFPPTTIGVAVVNGSGGGVQVLASPPSTAPPSGTPASAQLIVPPVDPAAPPLPPVAPPALPPRPAPALPPAPLAPLTPPAPAVPVAPPLPAAPPLGPVLQPNPTAESATTANANHTGDKRVFTMRHVRDAPGTVSTTHLTRRRHSPSLRSGSRSAHGQPGHHHAGGRGGERRADGDRVAPDEPAGALERRVLPRGDETTAREPLEILRQLEGGRVTPVGIHRDRLGDDRQQIGRQARFQRD